MASNEQGVSPFSGVLAFVAYLLFSAVLIVVIVSRLYRQHGTKKLNIDLANLILLTVLLSLPFALFELALGTFSTGSPS